MSNIGEAKAGLPAALYLDADAFARERRTIFTTEWQMIARASFLKEPGDYVCQTLAGWSVFAMRADSGETNAFRNVCRHQALPVLDQGAGHCKTLRCRYHGWTYDFAGRFKEATPKFPPADPNSPNNNLQTLPLDRWNDLLFVNLGASPPALPDVLQPLAAAIAGRDLGRLRFRGESTLELDCNWKVLVEQFLADRAIGEPDASGALWLWQWPTLGLRIEAGAMIVYQMIARTHLRSRLVTHVYTDEPADAASVEQKLAQAKADAAALKAQADARQKSLAAGEGEAAAGGASAQQFHAKVRDAHAGAAAAA